MSFLRGTEEYYQKFIELQEKLRRSEEERLVLEMKFNEMVQVTREEEQAYYRRLRNQYKRFLDEDRKRQERNERIMRVLERIESRAGMLAAKTERFELLRQQYLAYLRRISANSKQDHESIPPPQIPQDIPTIIEEKADLYDHPVIQKAMYGNRLSDIGHGERHGGDLYEHPVIKKALYGDKEDRKSSPKLDVVNQYLRSLATPISGEEVLKTTRSSEKLTLPKDFSDSNESNSYRDEYPPYKSNAGYIADRIINSINSKPRLSSPYHSNYDSKIPEKEKLYKPREEDVFCSTKTSPSRFKTGKIDDVEMFKYSNLSRDPVYSYIGEDEREDKDKFKRPEVRFKDLDYRSNDVPSEFPKAMQEYEDYNVEDYLPKMDNNTEKDTAEEENVLAENLGKEDDVEEDKCDDKKMSVSEQYEEPINTKEYLCKNNQELVNAMDNDNVNEAIKDRDYAEQTLDEVQSLASETKLELDAMEIEGKQKMEIEKDMCDEVIENEEISRELSAKDEFNKYNTEYEADATEDNEEDNVYNKHRQLLQQKVPIQNVKNNEESENIVRDGNQAYYQEYDVNGQPMSYYSENVKTNVEYEESIQSNIPDNEPKTNIQPDVEYNKDQSGIQYDNEREHVAQGDDKIPDSQSTPQNDQYEKSEHFETKEHIEENKQFREDFKPDNQSEQQKQTIPQYDESGGSFEQYERGQPIEYDNNAQPLMTYDNQGQPHVQYLENDQYNEPGQPIMQYDENGQPIMQYGENGQPIMMQYDENGQPIVQYDANGQPMMMQYNENGQPIMMQYDEHGQPIVQYDQNGQPIMMQYDQNGQPIPQYDEQGQHMLYDENGQPMVHYDENGQPIYQYGQGEEYYQDNQLYEDNTGPQQHYEEPQERIENIVEQREITKDVDAKEVVKEKAAADATKKQTKIADAKEKPPSDAAKNQTAKNADSKEKPAGDAAKKQTAKNADSKETEKDKSGADGVKKKTPSKTSEKKPNVIEMLDTDTESVKQDTKVSNDSDFDFSNS